MLAPPLPPDEEHRLQVLLNLNLLDTAPEERFDRITRMAARLFDVPVTVVGLIDADREWFKSRVGVAETEVPRQVSFCAHAILHDAELVVEDALADERFADNPFVTSGRLRFYAGAPLAAPDGSKVGTLCLIDDAPRTFDANDRMLLRDLAAVLSANPAAGALFGADPAALVGREAQSFAVESLSGMLAGQADGEVLTRQVTGCRLDGSHFPLEVMASAMLLGGVRRYAAVVRDTTARLEQAWRERAAGERRHKTFSQAAHELRTPLASILGFSELLLKRDFDASTARELLQIVNTQASNMSTVVNGVFDLARIEAGGKQALHIRPEPVAGVLTEALGMLAPLGHNARVVLALDPGLPPLAADPHRMALAFANVIGNSLQYSDPATPVTVRAWLEAVPGMSRVVIQVTDRGPGMTGTDLERLFEPFQRGSAANGTQGTGLGMAIVREVVDAHNGRIEVDSAPGQGTVVTLRLPAASEVAHG